VSLETEVVDGADRAPELSWHIGYLLRRAQQAHVAVWQSEVSKDVTSVQFGVLSVLARTPGASQTELCAQLDLDRSTIADIVARLERHGLIERIRDADDKRRNVLSLTATGRHELKELRRKVASVDHVLTENLDAAQISALRAILAAMVDSPSVRTRARMGGIVDAKGSGQKESYQHG
jgi:DNA-binding MarR family transcriptional regulator